MWRHTPQVRRLLELLERIGPVRTIRSTFSYVIATETDVRDRRACWTAASLMDVGCYCVSGCPAGGGRAASGSMAEQVLDESGVERRMSGLMRFPDDVMATFTSGFDRPLTRPWRSSASDGRILLPDPWHSTVRA